MSTDRLAGLAVLWIAISMAVLTHVAYWALDHEHCGVDTASYLIPADNLVRGLGLVNDLHQPELRRTPGYSLLLALFRIAPLRLQYLVIVQHTLCVLLTALVAVNGLRLSGSRLVALVAAAVLSLDLATLRIANLLMTEIISTVLIALTAWTLYRAMTTPSYKMRWVLASGLLGGCAALVRPVGTLYFTPLAICLILAPKGRRLRPALLFVGSFLLLPLLWATRNYVEGGYFGISTIGAEDILYYRAAGALAVQQPGGYLANVRGINRALIDQTCADLERLYQQDCSQVTEAQQASYSSRKGLRIILSNSFSYVRSVSISLAYIVFGGGAEALSRLSNLSPRMAEHIVLLVTVPEACLVLAGCRYWYRRDRKLFYVLVFTVGYFFVISAGAEAYSRFRVPAMPMYALLIGGGAGSILQTIRNKKAPRADLAGPIPMQP
jgi:4-amino-4-deoxy-L-arabinose transferase-like glycosyltransferase